MYRNLIVAIPPYREAIASTEQHSPFVANLLAGLAPRARAFCPVAAVCDRRQSVLHWAAILNAKDENSQFAFEKFQVANSRRAGGKASVRCIRLQRNALPSFSAGKIRLACLLRKGFLTAFHCSQQTITKYYERTRKHSVPRNRRPGRQRLQSRRLWLWRSAKAIPTPIRQHAGAGAGSAKRLQTPKPETTLIRSEPFHIRSIRESAPKVWRNSASVLFRLFFPLDCSRLGMRIYHSG